MKKIHITSTILSLLSAFPLMGQDGFQNVNSESELAVRVTERVQEIIGSLEDRLAAQAPIIDTLALEEGQKEPRILKLWMENEKAVKLVVSEPDETGAMVRQSTFYFGGQDLFFVGQPFARFRNIVAVVDNIPEHGDEVGVAGMLDRAFHVGALRVPMAAGQAHSPGIVTHRAGDAPVGA